MSLAYHVVFRFDDAAILAPDVPTRRAIARIVLQAGEERKLLGFGLADNHLHIVALGEERPSRLASECGRLIPLLRARKRRQEQARPEPAPTGQSVRAPGRPGKEPPRAPRFETARFIPVNNMYHLGNVFGYVQRQDTHHGIDQDPRREGTMIPDLLGLRVLAPWLLPAVRVTFPRFLGGELLAELGVDELVERLAPEHLVDATCAALGLAHLRGQRLEALLGHSAVVHIATPELYDREIAILLGASTRLVERARKLDIGPSLLSAVRLQMDLHCKVPAFDPTTPYSTKRVR